MQATFEAIIDWLFVAGTIAVVGMALISWIRKPRQSQTKIVGTNSWFFTASAWSKIVITPILLGVSFYLGYLLWTPFVNISSDVSTILRFAGLILFLGGDAFIIWSRWTLGMNWSVSTSFGVQLQPDHKLIQHGPFALVRHPMYVGFWIALTGATLAYHTWAALFLLLMALAIFYRRAAFEEAALAETFGDRWRTYAARVPKFIPRLK